MHVRSKGGWLGVWLGGWLAGRPNPPTPPPPAGAAPLQLTRSAIPAYSSAHIIGEIHDLVRTAHHEVTKQGATVQINIYLICSLYLVEPTKPSFCGHSK